MFFLGERERGAKHFQNENQLAINISMYSNPTREIYLAGETAKKKKRGNQRWPAGGGIQDAEISVFFRGPPQTKTSDEDDRRDEGRRLEAS